ncbi:hypothetical protein BN1723_008706 [Verticillium longisporum]|uniref:Uncharacterized protein n=1 Tax=Verticillium longisporum TaxID=100787 RepID=A0A0G4KIJ7_VERLO|nr:hypothetical protein BN1723_008706 [Verticillium longisporum]
MPRRKTAPTRPAAAAIADMPMPLAAADSLLPEPVIAGTSVSSATVDVELAEPVNRMVPAGVQTSAAAAESTWMWSLQSSSSFSMLPSAPWAQSASSVTYSMRSSDRDECMVQRHDSVCDKTASSTSGAGVGADPRMEMADERHSPASWRATMTLLAAKLWSLMFSMMRTAWTTSTSAVAEAAAKARSRTAWLSIVFVDVGVLGLRMRVCGEG